jgi:hypothetical protein
MRSDIPKSMQFFYFDFNWHQKELWRLKLDEQQINIDELLWQFDYPIWATKPPDEIFNLSPNEVLKNPKKYQQHWSRINKSDLSFPIHTIWNKNYLVILDGYHRLAKAFLSEQKTISAFMLEDFHIDLIKRR